MRQVVSLVDILSKDSICNHKPDPPAVNHLLPVEHPFNKSVLFVCVDVESYEKDHSKITEVGVATLDTRHLIGVAPGVDGKHWRTKINARHFRIREYQHLTNSQFVSGCPDRFEFGTSEFIDLDEAAKYVEACCKPSSDAAGGGVSLLDPEEQRNIVFLGHDTNTDVEYLRQLGFDVHALPNMLETLDSAVLHQFWTKQPDTTSLSKILGEFDIVGWHMHNAGNDAVYTVQAMLGVCVRESTLRGKEEVVKTEEPEVEEEEVWP